MTAWLREIATEPTTLGILSGLGLLLLLVPVVVEALHRVGRIDRVLRREVYQRTGSWLVIIPILVGPVLLGRTWVIATTAILAILCHREFARATGLFRDRVVSATVVVGIVALTFAAFDHWYGLYVALTTIVGVAIVIGGMWGPSPSGYLQRVALGSLAFLLFGVCLTHYSYFANDSHYRPLLLGLLLCIELNDVFAFVVGKSVGGPKLVPRISPGKTIAGSVGAMVLTTSLFCWVGHSMFAATPLAHPGHWIALGVIISITGQLGDLVLSSVKRDLGIKDMGQLIPGHGGLLDRFDSLLLAVPAAFHYVHYFAGVGLDRPVRVWTGNGG
ncbi:MAG: phosphatidate cytidylyltransferase [Planctomycetota bacterium]